MTRTEVVTEARRWIGTPYRPKGRSRAAGIDCIGLIVVVGQAFGVPHVDEQHYTDWPDPQRRMLTILDRYLTRVLPADPWEGTIGVFAESRLPGHLGVCTEKHAVRHLVHAAIRQHRVIEEPFDSDPRTRTLKVVVRYRFPELSLEA